MGIGIETLLWASAIIALLCISSLPQEQTGITRFDTKHGNALLIQDGVTQVLVGGGSDVYLLSALPSAMSWFDRRIEVLIVPTWKSEDTMSLVSLLDRYDVGVVVLPQSGKIDDQGKMLIHEILRRHVPYRFAQYGQYMQAGAIALRFMSPMNANTDIAFRMDMKDNSMIFLGNGDAKIQQQLVSFTPREAFPAHIVAMEQHGTKQSPITSELAARISPAISFSDLPRTASLMLRGSKWFMKCVNETDLPFLQHYCIH